MNAIPAISARRAASVAAEHAADVDQAGRFPAEAIAALKADGLMSAMVPRELGGQGLHVSAIAAHCNELARACASTATIYAMHQIQVACLVRHALDAAWHRDFARRLVQHQWLIASMTSEIGVGGHMRASLCALEHDGDRFSFQKSTATMSYGGYADVYFATSRSGAKAAPSDQVFVTLMRPDVTLHQTGVWNGLGLRGTCSGGFDLQASGHKDQVFPVPFVDVASDTMLPVSHLLWAANWLGIAGNAVERARAFLRAQAKTKPGVQPPGATRLAQAVGLIQMVQARLRVALDRFESLPPDASRDLLARDADMNALKLDASQMCLQAVEQAMMVCGMAGYRNDGPYTLGRHLRDMWAAPLMIGNDRVAANNGAILLAQRAELGGI